MRLLVASESPYKLAAVEEATRDIFMNSRTVEGYSVSSGINEQPVGHQETIQGATNRLNALKNQLEDTRYHLLIALENGIFSIETEDGTKWFDLAWVIVENSAGERALAHSAGVEFSKEDVEEASLRGFETTTVGSILAEKSSCLANDPQAYLCNEFIGRQNILAQAVRVAIGQLKRRTEEIVSSTVKPVVSK